MKLINIGFGNVALADRIIAIVSKAVRAYPFP